MFALLPHSGSSLPSVSTSKARPERLSSKRLCSYADKREDQPQVDRLKYGESSHASNASRYLPFIRTADIPRAVDTHLLAFEHDPVLNYVKYTPVRSDLNASCAGN